MRKRFQSALAAVDKQAWMRFFGALLGLALAFACALFSTVARQAGNGLATGVLASAALLIAGWVGLTTVPYLARRLAFTRVRHALDYEVTREGLAYMAVVLVIGVAALNSGNNLLFIVVSAMLAAIIVSGIASAVALRALELQVIVPERVFARAGVLARVTVRNTRRLLPVFSVSVVAPAQSSRKIRWRWRPSDFHVPLLRRPKRRLRVPDVKLVRDSAGDEGRTLLATPVYFPYIPPHAAASADVELTFARRGRYVQETFGLATRFPFSFLLKTRRMRLEREVLVYPPVEPTDELFEILPLMTGEFESFVAGRGHDLYRIREYSPGDPARHVDWKATAKTGSLMVREFSREDERQLRIVFDNPGAGAISLGSYERGITLAASLAWHFAGENAQLSFATPDFSSADLHDFLRYLALAMPGEADGLLESLAIGREYNIIFTARRRGSIPTVLWTCSYFIFLE